MMLDGCFFCLVDMGDVRFMMEEIVGEVIAYVSKNPSAEHCRCRIPIPVKDSMGEFVEGSCKGDE